jgi:hypothetical protein
MAKKEIAPELNVTRERMVRLLNEDLAGACQAIIADTVNRQVPKGAAHTDIARELSPSDCKPDAERFEFRHLWSTLPSRTGPIC